MPSRFKKNKFDNNLDLDKFLLNGSTIYPEDTEESSESDFEGQFEHNLKRFRRPSDSIDVTRDEPSDFGTISK